MKRKTLIFVCLLMLITIVVPVLTVPVFADPEQNDTQIDLAKNSKSAILIEASSMSQIYGENENEKLFPASMTKMMSMLLVLEEINANRLSWEDLVVTSENAASMGGSQVYLEVGETMSVRDLFKAVAIASANDAIVALAEKVSITEENFVNKMNEKAKSFGLKDTNFVNPSGLHDDNHYSTAHDMAIIAKHLLDVGKDELIEYTTMYEAYIRENTSEKFWLVNTNKLLKSYEGMTGLKTGFTQQAGYSITVSAQRNGLVFIAVVMGADTPANRNADATRLLDYGYSLYESKKLFSEGEAVEQIKITNGKTPVVDLITRKDIYYASKKGSEQSEPNIKIKLIKEKAPIMSGENVAVLTITTKDGLKYEEILTVNEDILPLTWIDNFKKTFYKIFA